MVLNKYLLQDLTEIVHFDSFSRVTINISEPCHKNEVLNLCKYENCRGSSILDKMDFKPIPFDNYKNGKCEKEEETIGTTVNIKHLIQDNTGYKYGADYIWEKIHNMAGNIEKLVSGLHFSITIHIAHYYKRVGGIYLSNFTKYEKTYKDEHRDGLFILYVVILKAISKLDKNIFFCVKLKDDNMDNKKVEKFIETLCELELKEFNFEYNSVYFNKIDFYLDCIECGTCRLWGKIQFKGLESALKLLNEEEISSREAFYLFHLLKKISDSIEFYRKHEQEKRIIDPTKHITYKINMKKYIYI